jgi:hypothetical protein
MRSVANWIQWTVVFLILGAAAWFVYPEIDPFESSGGVPPYVRLKQTVFPAKSNLWQLSPASSKNQSPS